MWYFFSNFMILGTFIKKLLAISMTKALYFTKDWLNYCPVFLNHFTQYRCRGRLEAFSFWSVILEIPWEYFQSSFLSFHLRSRWWLIVQKLWLFDKLYSFLTSMFKRQNFSSTFCDNCAYFYNQTLSSIDISKWYFSLLSSAPTRFQNCLACKPLRTTLFRLSFTLTSLWITTTDIVISRKK